ncbi:MAG: fumarylacetoacetate hydrolase family protein, partial [Acidimicrobiales bacterium]
MRIANINARATIVTNDGLIDVEEASGGAFSHDVDVLVARLDEVATWWSTASPSVTSTTEANVVLSDPGLGPALNNPGQIFAIGVNYRAHAAEMGLAPPATPMVFTKFPSAIAGANARVPLPSSTTDWEAELVV